MTVTTQTRPGAQLIVEHVLDAWDLVDPLRTAVRLLLEAGRFAPVVGLVDVKALIQDARLDGSNRGRRSSGLSATEVAGAFLGRDARLRSVLIELRWAALAGSAAERDSHLAVAEERLAEVIAAMSEVNG
jgi:hypothetical protein